MNSILRKAIHVGAACALAFMITGCVLAPPEREVETAKLDHAGNAYRQRFADRELPELPSRPTWEEVLRRALVANGDVEAAYYEWAAAVARVQQAGGYPNTSLALGYQYTFSGERLKAWDRTSLTAGADTMQNLSFPLKTYQAGKMALHDAQAAGERFLAAKLDLQRQVLTEYFDYVLLAETTRIHRENVALLRLIYDTTRDRVGTGQQQADLLRAEVALRTAQDEVKSNESDLPQKRAMLNAMMARVPEAPLDPPDSIPAPRSIPGTDAQLLVAVASQNPELAALSRDVQGRQDALELARMRYIPDINPMIGFTGSIEQSVGAMIILPTIIPQIEGAIKESRSDLHRVEAMYRQRRFDRAAGVVAALYATRNAERQVQVFEREILPRAQQTLDVIRQSYTAGASSFIDLVEAQRTLLDVRLMIAQARVAREKSLVALEAAAGLDIETLGHATSQPSTTQPPTEAASTKQTEVSP